MSEVYVYQSMVLKVERKEELVSLVERLEKLSQDWKTRLADWQTGLRDLIHGGTMLC